MDKKKKALNLIVEQGILPLYFHPDVNTSIQVLKALYRGGVRVVEYSNRGEVALNNFLQLRKVVDTELPGLLLGVGTVKSKIDATEFVNEGADFIICPGVIEEVAALIQRNDLLWIPTCMSTTELNVAEDLDAKLVKLFPGNLLGPAYVIAVKEIFPDLLFIASGGEVSEVNLSAWFKSGVSSIGLGKELISAHFMETKNYTSIESSTQEALQMAKKARTAM